ncbi:helix-turn-helix transcriptional regulator [Paraburkholderia sp. SIMBA_049]
MSKYDRFIEDSFSRLIESSHSIRGNFDRGRHAESLRILLDRTALTSGRLSVLLGVSHGIVRNWLSGKAFPSPANIFRICYCFDIGIVDFLTGCHDKFPAASSRELPENVRQQAKVRRPSREVNWSAVKSHLDAVVSGEIMEISTLAIAKRFGLDTAQIYKRFGEEYRAASRICAEHRRTQHLAIRAARNRSLVSEVEAEVAKLLRKGEFPAMKRILHALVKRRVAVDHKRDRDIVSRVRRELLGL